MQLLNFVKFILLAEMLAKFLECLYSIGHVVVLVMFLNDLTISQTIQYFLELLSELCDFFVEAYFDSSVIIDCQWFYAFDLQFEQFKKLLDPGCVFVDLEVELGREPEEQLELIENSGQANLNFY